MIPSVGNAVAAHETINGTVAIVVVVLTRPREEDDFFLKKVDNGSVWRSGQ